MRLGAARGEINKEAFAWRFKKNLPFVAAPLVYEGVFYIVKDGGIITSLDPATGKVLKQGRSPEGLGEYFASPVAADGKVYVWRTPKEDYGVDGGRQLGGAAGECNGGGGTRDTGGDGRPRLCADARGIVLLWGFTVAVRYKVETGCYRIHLIN